MKKLLLVICVMLMSLSALAGPNEKLVEFIDQQIQAYEMSESQKNVYLAPNETATVPEYELGQVWMQVLARFTLPLGLFRMSLKPHVEIEFGK
jgi:hypothetical protein